MPQTPVATQVDVEASFEIGRPVRSLFGQRDWPPFAIHSEQVLGKVQGEPLVYENQSQYMELGEALLIATRLAQPGQTLYVSDFSSHVVAQVRPL